MKKTNLRDTLSVLTLGLVISACGPSVQQTTLQNQQPYSNQAKVSHYEFFKQDALKKLKERGMAIDDTARCTDNDSEYIDMLAEAAAVDKYFRERGEDVMESIEINGRNLALTDKGLVYEVGHQNLSSVWSTARQVYCAQASPPQDVTLTDLTEKDFDKLRR